MPNRIIKESIWTSPNINSLSIEAERHFYRILLAVDDYGCFEATPLVVKGKCYPLAENVGSNNVVKWQTELFEKDIIRMWKDGGRIYGVFVSFDEHNSKYAVTDDGKPTRHRRKTPEPPKDIFFDKDNIEWVLQESLPVFASFSQSLHNPNPNPNPNPIKLHSSTSQKRTQGEDSTKNSSKNNSDSMGDTEPMTNSGTKKTSPESKKDAEMQQHAVELAKYLLAEAARAFNRKLIATTRSTSPPILKLLKRGVAVDEIKSTISWLYGPNMGATYTIEVQSGKSLFDKWDRIQAARMRHIRNDDEYFKT